MYYFLMHKDKKVALCKNGKTIKIYNEKLLPIGSEKIEEQYDISKWENKRSISTERIDYNKLKDAISKTNMNIEDMSKYNYGLSLTDNYWFYQINDIYPMILFKIKFKKYEKVIPQYKTINYFQNQPQSKLMEKILCNIDLTEEDLKTPDFTTNGNNKKFWVVRKNQYYLVKINDKIKELTAEKEVLASFVEYIINECKKEAKKKTVQIASCQFEKGKDTNLNCCYSELFTGINEELTTYDMITNNIDAETPKKKMEKFLAENEMSILGLKDYFDFIILLDYLIENNRSENSIGFIINSFSNKAMKPSPVFGNSESFLYMYKDISRSNRSLYNSKHINVFGMNEEEQCKYIVDNLTWLKPKEIFQKVDLISEYLMSSDMNGLTTNNKENIINWLNYKIVLLQHTLKQKMIAEEMETDDDNEEDYQDEDNYDDYDDYDEYSSNIYENY